MRKSTARAHVNIALVKYWGKLPGEQKLPATGSLSFTIAPFFTETTVCFSKEQESDQLFIDGLSTDGNALLRTTRVLDTIRIQCGLQEFARVESQNFVPAGQGLASSASAFAALALAATHAANQKVSLEKLSSLARLGSGSAARSVYGDFCWIPEAGLDHALPLKSSPTLDISLVIAQVDTTQKKVSSSEGMKQTETTSPYYQAWLSSHQRDLDEALSAVTKGNFELLGKVTERNALKMHAAAIAADPGILYWNGATVEVIHAIRTLREEKIKTYFTADAGAHPITLCQTKDAETVAERLAKIPGVIKTVLAPRGPAAYIKNTV